MLTKTNLISVAKEAKVNDGYVFIINHNAEVKAIFRSKTDYCPDEVLMDSSIIKIIQPDSILKYDWTTWKLKDCSIDTMIDGINKEFNSITGHQK